MTPRDFILHWHREARLAPPRLVPNSWERQAVLLMERGISADDLSLVAKWMLLQLARSQSGERNSVAFNAASFQWPKMFGRIGDVEQGDEFERFAAMLASAEAARKPAALPVQKPCALPAQPVDEQRAREIHAETMRKFRESMEGGPR